MPMTEDEKKEAHHRRLMKRWREAHPDYNKKWRAKNRERVRFLKRRWRSDPENVKREKAWAQARQHKGDDK